MSKRLTYTQKIQAQKQKLDQIRNDGSRTVARYDEIIKLRTLLLDLMEEADRQEPPLTGVEIRLIDKVKEMSKKWGKKGDCV